MKPERRLSANGICAGESKLNTEFLTWTKAPRSDPGVCLVNSEKHST